MKLRHIRYAIVAAALVSAIKTVALCYTMQWVVCHSGGPATRTIPAGDPCAGETIAGTDGTGLVWTAALGLGDTGYSDTQNATSNNTCVWAFTYECAQIDGIEIQFSSPYQRHEATGQKVNCN